MVKNKEGDCCIGKLRGTEEKLGNYRKEHDIQSLNKLGTEEIELG